MKNLLHVNVEGIQEVLESQQSGDAAAVINKGDSSVTIIVVIGGVRESVTLTAGQKWEVPAGIERVELERHYAFLTTVPDGNPGTEPPGNIGWGVENL